jgi:hypothetical protein
MNVTSLEDFLPPQPQKNDDEHDAADDGILMQQDGGISIW